MLLVYKSSAFVNEEGRGELLPAVMIAFSELFVYHHQVARPYAFGAFFVALTAYGYFAWFYEERKNKYLILFALGAILAAYTHYLALLSVLVIGFSALWRDRKNPKPWLMLGLTVLALFSPYLSSFWYQLQLGGVGQWLGSPEADWLINYFDYLFNYFSYSSLLGTGIMLLFLFNAWRHKFWEGWLWFASVFLIAFLYSIFRNPVLQFSSLIFLSPFLFIQKRAGSKSLYEPAFLSFLLIWSLVDDRRYYTDAQVSPPKEVARYLEDAPIKNQPIYYHWSPEKWDFYRQIDPTIPRGQYWEQFLADSLSADAFTMVLDHATPGFWPAQAMGEGYKIKEVNYYFGFSIYQFERLEEKLRPVHEGLISFNKTQIPQEAKHYLHLGTAIDFKGLPPSQLIIRFDEIQIEEPMHLVFQAMDDGEQKAWYAHPLDSNTRYLNQPISGEELDYEWRIILDKGRAEAKAQGSVSYQAWPDNPIIYGLVKRL